MVSHTDAAGLVSEYKYDHYTPDRQSHPATGLPLGEEWRFTYHEGYTEVTDAYWAMPSNIVRLQQQS